MNPSRKALITSKEYWQVNIAMRLWEIDGKPRAYSKYEKLANKIVDKEFMEHIMELTGKKINK